MIATSARTTDILPTVDNPSVWETLRQHRSVKASVGDRSSRGRVVAMASLDERHGDYHEPTHRSRMFEPHHRTQITTGTATLAVFDPSSIAHRATDDADWWSVPRDELEEVNKGNVLFVGLGSDGTYEIEVHRGIGELGGEQAQVVAQLRVRSGCIYIGAAENVPSAGFGPETVHGGCLVAVRSGTCEVRVSRLSPVRIAVEYQHSGNASANEFEMSPSL